MAHPWYELQANTRLAGYSWKRNQYWLTMDTITQFELVLLNREVKVVIEKD